MRGRGGRRGLGAAAEIEGLVNAWMDAARGFPRGAVDALAKDPFFVHDADADFCRNQPRLLVEFIVLEVWAPFADLERAVQNDEPPESEDVPEVSAAQVSAARHEEFLEQESRLLDLESTQAQIKFLDMVADQFRLWPANTGQPSCAHDDGHWR